MLDERAKLLLKALIERYIADGQPVGSRTLSRASGLELSPATIRNVMSDLEELGLIASPHTSAGRVPTARGYRLFVDTMLTVQGSELTPELPAEQPQKVIANAAQLLSNMSQFVGVVMAPRRSSVFKHIEFVKLSEHRVLLIIVSPQGDVQNRVLFTDVEFDARSSPPPPTSSTHTTPVWTLKRCASASSRKWCACRVKWSNSCSLLSTWAPKP